MAETHSTLIEETPITGQPEQLELFVNLDGFEGPIDMLLSLAREQKVDLTKISILPLAEQYIEFIKNVSDLDLEIAADYLVVAAWLTFLKSRLLLPNPEPDETDEVMGMTENLRYQLLRLEAMQKAAKTLLLRPKLGQQRFSRGSSETFKIENKTVTTVNLYDLLACYGDIRSASENETLTIAATQLFSIEEATRRLKSLIKMADRWTVLAHYLPRGLKSNIDFRSATASYLVASLELAQEGALSLRQDNNFAPLYIKKKEK